MLFIFDMGGVVANSSCTEKICARLGIGMHDFYLYQLDSEGRNTYQDLSIGMIDSKKYWENFSLNSGIDISEDLFKVLYSPKVDRALIVLINQLRKGGYRVVCGTNTIESHFEEHLRLGNYSIFDLVYSSHLMGVKKPSLDFFKKIIELERVSADYVYFIDDDECNVEGARDFGMNTHLFFSAEHLQEAFSEFLT